MKIVSTLILAVLIGSVVSSRGGTSIAVNFSGRGVGNDAAAGASLTTSESAGVVPQIHWNNIDVRSTGAGNGFTGKTLGLLDSAYNFTAVKVIYDASDSWSSGGGIGSPDEKLMKGIIKANPNPDTAPTGNTDRMLFTITNVPAGVYTVDVYLMENDINCTAIGGTGAACAEATVTIGATSYYVEQQGNFNGTFLKAT